MLEEEKVHGERASTSVLSAQFSDFRPQVSGFFSSPSLLIVGGESMIGGALAREAKHLNTPFQVTSRRRDARWPLDLSKHPESWQLPDTSAAILCAATTSLAKCEAAPQETRKINTEATITLAENLAEQGKSIIFLSTSRVFPPWLENPCESTAPEPVTEYGRQKLAVEEYLLRNHPAAKIIRLSKVISPSLPLLEFWSRSLDRREPVKAFQDFFLSPIALKSSAKAILQISLGPTPGIFHLSASDAISYFEVAQFIARRQDCETSVVQPASSPQSNTPGSTILACPRTIKTTPFRPITAMENLHAAFARSTP
jgi:dTDP-4-dehydrorhamnose reductase